MCRGDAAVLDFGDSSVDVDVLPRSNELAELRRQHRATHVLRAERDEILAVAIVEGAPRLSERRRVVSLRENPDFACNLWREALLRQMAARDKGSVEQRSPAAGAWRDRSQGEREAIVVGRRDCDGALVLP